MAKLPPFPGTTGRRDWRTAFDAIKKLLANGDDTTQVFRIMRALNVGNGPMNYARLLGTTQQLTVTATGGAKLRIVVYSGSKAVYDSGSLGNEGSARFVWPSGAWYVLYATSGTGGPSSVGGTLVAVPE